MPRHRAHPDPDVTLLLEDRRARRPASMRETGLAAVRAGLEALPHPADLPKMADVADREIPCGHGNMPIRIYSPTGDDVLPAIVYFHGGGMVMGSNHSFEPLARVFAAETGHRVVAVDYHLAPEHPSPGQVDDAWAALLWVAEHAAEIGVAPDRLSVLGDSAGGTLAALVALRARDEGGPPLFSQVLVYGGVDRDMAAPSLLELGDDGVGMTRDDVFFLHAVARAGQPEPSGPEEVPAYAADLSGLPQTIVVVGELDPIRDWSERYATRLRDAGVQTTVTRYPGVGHGFVMQFAHLARGRQAVAEIAALLRAKTAHSLPW